MHTVTSPDGTQIAYDRYGEGPAVILISGALGYRKFKRFEQIATALSEHCTVINYDRRGHGDSGGAGTVSVQHGMDYIAALIAALGGRESLCGWSSGGAVALRAAAAASASRSSWSTRRRSRPTPTPSTRLTTTARGSIRSSHRRPHRRRQALHAKRGRDTWTARGRDVAAGRCSRSSPPTGTR
jgi:alpha/beta hydrolase family protein